MKIKKRSGSAKIFFDHEIKELRGSLYDYDLYHSGVCCKCLLCDDWCVNGSDTWHLLERHCIHDHFEFIGPVILDGREVDPDFLELVPFLKDAPYNQTQVTKKIYKASLAYYDMKGFGEGAIPIASEFGQSMFKIEDTGIDTERQRREIKKAVEHGLNLLSQGKTICYMCAGGRSRSPVLACLVASIENDKFNFNDYFSKLRLEDETVRKDSEILPLVREMYPKEFE